MLFECLDSCIFIPAVVLVGSYASFVVHPYICFIGILVVLSERETEREREREREREIERQREIEKESQSSQLSK